MGNTNNTPIASCTGRILVVKDGKDGVSITGADVIFAVYNSQTSAPADDYKGWKTLYSELVFIDNYYLWTAIRITNTNGKSWLTGKRCLGSCKDFADIKEKYALGDSGSEAPTEGWGYSYTPVKGKYLWAKNEITYQNNTDKIETTPICIGYFGNDGINGTKFSPRGTANGHYASYADYKASVQLLPDEMYLVDTVTDKYENIHGAATISYDKLITGNEVILVAEEGDAYNIEGTLWVATANGWVDFGSIQGAQGESGKNAPWVILSKNPIVFESNENGEVVSSYKLTDITVMCGTEIVTSQCTFAFKESNDSHFNINNGNASITAGGMETETITIKSTGLGTKNIGGTGDDGDDGYEIPYPNSFVTLVVTFGDYVFDVTINIVVDTSLVDGYFRTSIKGIEAQYTKVSTTISDQKALLNVCQAKIDANADSINTKVSQEDYGADNTKREERFSAIEQKAGEINQTVTHINDLTGQWEKSGIVTKADFSTMFSEAVSSNDSIVKRAEMGTYVTKDEDGNLESGVKIKADNITLEGYTTVNRNFHIKEDGSYESYDPTTGNRITISAKEGKILLEGPSEVDIFTGLPTSNSTFIPLAQLWFATDPTTKKRYAQIRFDGNDGGSDVWIDGHDGIVIEDGAGYAVLRRAGVSFTRAKDNKVFSKTWEELLS